MQVLSLGQEDLLEEGMAAHSSILFWRLPWTQEPGGLWSVGSQRVARDLSDLARTHSYIVTLRLLQAPVVLKMLYYFSQRLSVQSSSLVSVLILLHAVSVQQPRTEVSRQITQRPGEGLSAPHCTEILRLSRIPWSWEAFFWEQEKSHSNQHKGRGVCGFIIKTRDLTEMKISQATWDPK